MTFHNIFAEKKSTLDSEIKERERENLSLKFNMQETRYAIIIKIPLFYYS